MRFALSLITMTEYVKTNLTGNIWVVTERGRDYTRPLPWHTFAFDTETFAFIDGVKVSNEELVKKCLSMTPKEKRKRITTNVWCWQVYDEINGFFMTNDFDTWLIYQAQCRYKFGWCYNAKFDFSQIDYKILTNPKWKRKEKATRNEGYNRGQPWAFESLHNDMGTRYAYKLWIPYKNVNRHEYVHAVEYRDFMNIFAGGLARMLKSLDVRDNEGNTVRKLEMDYQGVDVDNLKQSEIEYCANDVKGLYFGVKQYNQMIEEQSNGERHIFGEKTNVMTAGGFAKAELLRSLYPELSPKKRIKQYQREHPITPEQDKYLRNNHLYRGGICLVNPKYQGKLLTGRTMYRYDVNSEYPFAMANIRDLVGKPDKMKFDEWLKFQKKEQYECVYILKSVHGYLKKGYVPVWYNPFTRDYVKNIDEHETHLMFEREFNELCKWYDLDFDCDTVLIFKRGDYAYKPFIDENYKLKAQAKRENNVALSNVVKLKLNSSYGKLAERVERVTGIYEINEETGAVHFVATGTENDTGGIMNVAIGALVTATARVWILSHIREICQEEKIEDLFVYIDTDSIHGFGYYDKADAYTLGGFKLEAECKAVKYLCPKTYFDIEGLTGDYIVVIDGKPQIEMHTKGINITSVSNDFAKQITSNGLPLKYVNNRFDYAQSFNVLCAMNVRGGKVLIPTEKFLAREEQNPERLVINYGYDGTFLSEL